MHRHLERIKVSYDITKLAPVINQKGFHEHYNGNYKAYVDHFNSGEGDLAFNRAGAFLHDIYFRNIRERRENNAPIGKAEHVINMRYGSFDGFKRTVFNKAKELQGSGWIYMNQAGYVNLIPNHRIVEGVCLLIDMWEHAYVYTHGHNKDEYIDEMWKIVNWDDVNQRLLTPIKKQD